MGEHGLSENAIAVLRSDSRCFREEVLVGRIVTRNREVPLRYGDAIPAVDAYDVETVTVGDLRQHMRGLYLDLAAMRQRAEKAEARVKELEKRVETLTRPTNRSEASGQHVDLGDMGGLTDA